MTTLAATSPVTRETSAFVRDRGMRPIIATLRGGVLILRAKGLRTHETLDIASCYNSAVKARVAQERADKKASRAGKGSRRNTGNVLRMVGGRRA